MLSSVFTSSLLAYPLPLVQLVRPFIKQNLDLIGLHFSLFCIMSSGVWNPQLYGNLIPLGYTTFCFHPNARNLLHMHNYVHVKIVSVAWLSVQAKGGLKIIQKPKIVSRKWEDFFIEFLVTANYCTLHSKTVASKK